MKSQGLSIVAILGLIGCGGGVTVVLEGKPDLNPSKQGTPTSVTVRLYQLKSADRFDRADFDDLWRKDVETLAEDRVERMEKTLLPGQKLSLDIAPKDGVKFIGIVALFSDSTQGPWRQIMRLDNESALTLILSGHRIQRGP